VGASGGKRSLLFDGAALRTGSCLSNRNRHKYNFSDVTMCVVSGVL
jgi:hypothetical protein